MDEFELRSVARLAAPSNDQMWSWNASALGELVNGAARTNLSRRLDAADGIFDRAGARLHAFACALTSNPDLAARLVVDAISSRSWPDHSPDAHDLLRVLAADTYVMWSYEVPMATSAGVWGTWSTSESAIHLLPDEHRVALALCMFGEHTYAQAARIMTLTGVEVTRLLKDALAFLAAPDHAHAVPGQDNHVLP